MRAGIEKVYVDICSLKSDPSVPTRLVFQRNSKLCFTLNYQNMIAQRPKNKSKKTLLWWIIKVNTTLMGFILLTRWLFPGESEMSDAEGSCFGESGSESDLGAASTYCLLPSRAGAGGMIDCPEPEGASQPEIGPKWATKLRDILNDATNVLKS